MIHTKTLLVDEVFFHATDMTMLTVAEYCVENARVFETDEAVRYARVEGSHYEVLLLKDGALVKRPDGRIVKNSVQKHKLSWDELFERFETGMEVYKQWKDTDDEIEDERAKLFERLDILAKRQDRNSEQAARMLDERLPAWRTMLRLPEDDDD